MFKRALSLFICIIMLTSTFVGTGVTVSANNELADEILSQAQAEPIEEPIEEPIVEPSVSAPEMPTVTADRNSSVIIPDTATETYSGKCGDNLTWSLDTETGVFTIDGTGDMYDYFLSSVPWYSYNSYIKSVTIGDSVTSISEDAFYRCTSLVSVTIGDSVTSIGSHAFYRCTALANVTIPDSVTSIGDYAFAYCNSLTSVTIGDSVTSIGDGTFFLCTYLASVHITDIAAWCTISFGNNSSPLSDAYNLYLNGKLVTDLVIPDSVTNISDYAFYYCTSLTSVTIPDSVTSIGNEAFYHCDSLTNVTIPDSVTSIGNEAFYHCESLTSLIIRDSVTSIGQGAFKYCSSLTIKCNPNSYAHTYAIDNSIAYILLVVVSGTCGDDLTWTLDNETDILTIDGTGDMYNYSEEYYNSSYRTTAPWKDYGSSIKSIVIGDSVTSIGDYAFYYFKSLTSIVIGDSVTSIGNYAFYYCNSITSVTIPDSVTSIGKYAFFDCDSLVSVTIGSSVESIGYGAFSSCTSLVSVTIPDSVTSIGIYAFSSCTSLTNIVIGNSVKSIGSYAFQHCTSLVSVIIPDSVTSIGEYAFAGDYNYNMKLASVTIGDSVTSIGSHAFYYCRSLTSVTIGNSVRSIGSFAFYNCTSLTSVTIPDSVTSIGSDAFRYYNDGYKPLNLIIRCNSNSYAHTFAINNGFVYEILNVVSVKCGDNLTWSFDITTGILTIDGTGDMYDYTQETHNNSYRTTAPWNDYISSIKSVIIGDSVTSIGEYAFYYCQSITSVTIGDSVTNIGKYAFAGSYDYKMNLKSVTIGDSVTSIGSYAFLHCSYLASVHITDIAAWCGISFDDYYSNPLYYAHKLYLNGELVTDLVIPDSVTNIGDYAFYYCSYLTSVTIPDSVTSIGESAFYYCNSLTSVHITDIAAWCNLSFDNNSTPLYYAYSMYLNGELVTDLVIPDSVTSISNNTFRNCSSLTSVTIPDSVTSISDNAFYNCTSLASVTIPESVTSIGSYVFYNCTSLTSVTFPESVTSIGNYTFRNCTSLTSVTIPDSVTSIGDNAFYNCTSLTIKCNAFSYAHTYAVNNSIAYELLDYAAAGTCGYNLKWTLTDTTGVLTIYGTGSIYNYSSSSGTPWYSYRSHIKTVVISDSVTSIGNNTFYSCESIVSVTIPKSVTSIGNYAFGKCTSLTNLTIPNSVTSIGYGAFKYCTSLISVTLPDSVTYIDDGTFSNCTALTSMSIPDSVTSIGDYAFEYCTSLTSVTIPDSVTDIGVYVFEGCISLTSVYITDIAAWCGIIFGESIDNPLYYAENLYLNGELVTNLVIPDSVTSISNYAFCNCTSLTSVTIPDSVTSIGNYAFHYYDNGYKTLDITVKCYKNSYAHTYAVNNGFEYEFICSHIFTNYISDNNVTCTENGTKTAFCDNGCGATDTVVDEGSALGHIWSEWIVTVEPTYTEEGEQIRFCFVCDAGENEAIPTLPNPNLPVISVDNFKVTITDAEYIKDMRYAPGEYTTTTEIRNAEGNVAISESLVVKYTVDGNFVYDMPNAGYFTIWIRMKDGTNYILPLDVTKVTPSISTYGVKITIHNLYNVKDFYIAKGEYQTYREIKDNGYIVSVTGVKIGNKHDYTYTVYEPGVHTILVRYNDGTQALFHETLVVDEPVFTTNGLQVTISNLPDVKVIRTAYGEWNTVKELKATDTIRNFSSKTAIKGKDPYTIQYREDGMVTVIVEYNNGYQKVFHYNVQHKQASCTQTGSTVLLRNLDGLVMIRYAMGTYTTSAEIKRAPGSKYLKPADLTNGYAIISGLGKGTYTFCVQFDDESYNYFTVTVK